jgi:hypothetical protein
MVLGSMFSAFRIILYDTIEVFSPRIRKYQQVQENCRNQLNSFTIFILHEKIISVAKSRAIKVRHIAHNGENVNVYTTGTENVKGRKRSTGKLRCR